MEDTQNTAPEKDNIIKKHKFQNSIAHFLILSNKLKEPQALS